MAGAMTPEPDGQHFRSRAELADEASRLDVGEVVDVQVEVGHRDTFRIEVVYGLEDKSAGELRIVLRMSPRIVFKRNLSKSVGMGLMVGIELSKPAASEIVSKALDDGLVISKVSPSILRFLPSLVISKSDLKILLGWLMENLGNF